MAKLSKAETMQGVAAMKTLHALALKTEDDDVIRAVKACHERVKRFAEDDGNGDVVALGGDT